MNRQTWKTLAFAVLVGMAVAVYPSHSCAQAGPDIELPETNLEAGIASVDITPPIGTMLAGYRNRREPSTGIHDSLKAQVFVFDDGAKKAALIAVDTIMILQSDGDAIRKAFTTATGIPDDFIMINASHTHGSPALHRAELYRNEVVKKIAGAATLAVNRLRPVSIGYGVGTIDFNISRRTVGADGRIMPGPLNPDGPCDHRLKVLRVDVDSDSVAPMAVLMHAVCHPNVFRGGNNEISADFPGIGRTLLERNFGPRTTGMFIQGCCGDIRSNMPPDETNGWRDGSEHDMTWCGWTLGTEAMRVAARARVREFARNRETTFTISAGRELLEITPRDLDKPTPEGRTPYTGRDTMENGKLIVPVGALKIGPYLFVGLPGEPVVEYGLSIEEDLADTGCTVFVLGLTTGDAGYIPVAHQIAEGGYEAKGPYGEKSEQEIRGGVRELVASIMD